MQRKAGARLITAVLTQKVLDSTNAPATEAVGASALVQSSKDTWKQLEEKGARKSVAIMLRTMAQHDAGVLAVRDAEEDFETLGCKTPGEALQSFRAYTKCMHSMGPSGLEEQTHHDEWEKFCDLLTAAGDFKWMFDKKQSFKALILLFRAVGEDQGLAYNLLEMIDTKRKEEKPRGISLTGLVIKTAHIITVQGCDPELAMEQVFGEIRPQQRKAKNYNSSHEEVGRRDRNAEGEARNLSQRGEDFEEGSWGNNDI